MQVGEFLKQKVTNMAHWAVEHIGIDSMPVDIVRVVDDLGSVEVTFLAEVLKEHHTSIVHRDWAAIIRLLSNEPHVPNELITVMQMIRAKEEMHDKFWRYLKLFSETVQE